MSLRRALSSLASQRRVLGAFCFQSSRNYCPLPKEPYKTRPVPLNDQSVLLPGKERIRSSKLLENPCELVSQIPECSNIKTVYEVLYHGMKVSDDGDCIGTRYGDEGYKWQSYSDVISKTQHIGSGLIELGLKPGNETFVGIFAANREEFLITMYACAAYSMVLVPLYISLGLQSIFFIINQANLPLVIANSQDNALKVFQNIKQLPSLRTVVMVDEPTPQITQLAKESGVKLTRYSEVEIRGRTHKKDLMLPDQDDLFCIPYTSGTTGIPKGVMLTHRNMIACVASLVYGYGEGGFYGGTIMSYLPPAHIYEIANEVASLHFARRIAFYSGDIKDLMAEVRYIKPDILTLVPRLMNAIYANVMESVKESYLKTFLVKTALARKEKLLKRGKVTNQSIWDKLVFKKFQMALGGNVGMIVCTSAPISAEVIRFFRIASGAYVFEAYGQTEMLAAVMTLPLEYEGGNVGAPLPCNYVKLADVPEMGYHSKNDMGEVCIKGPNVFKGYFKNEEATAESLQGEWQHTGDIGKWLPNGTLKIMDRKKHIFKLSQGEYIAPEKVENVYSQLKLVSQIFVDGLSDQDYIIALVVPEMTNLKKWMKSKGHKEIADLNSNKELKKDFLLELRKLGSEKDLNPLEQARNLKFLTEPFSIENELLTPTLKMRRSHARQHYESTIRHLYEEGPLE